MDQLDETIHQPVRLKIMAALKALPTEGNLGAHLATLEKSGYIEITKDFVGKKPRTRVAMTASGRRAFERYVDYLRGILDGTS
jgi:DNA-binding PadR family transcriptional regulator